MSTDFNTNTIQTEGSIRPKSIDTPLDIRTRVETEKDILSIPSPYIGMVVYVKDTGKRFEVLTLKNKKQGFSVIKNAAVGTYREIISKFDVVNTIEERNIYSEKGYVSPGMSIYVLENQKEYRYINDTWVEILNDLSQIHGHDNKDVLDSITLSDIENWNAKSNFSGSYNDLTDLPELPTKISDLANDINLATETFVIDKIAEIDLSDYATLNDISAFIDEDKLTMTLNDYVLNKDLEDNYATILYVDELIKNHEHITMSDTDVDEIFNNLYQ